MRAVSHDLKLAKVPLRMSCQSPGYSRSAGLHGPRGAEARWAGIADMKLPAACEKAAVCMWANVFGRAPGAVRLRTAGDGGRRRDGRGGAPAGRRGHLHRLRRRRAAPGRRRGRRLVCAQHPAAAGCGRVRVPCELCPYSLWACLDIAHTCLANSALWVSAWYALSSRLAVQVSACYELCLKCCGVSCSRASRWGPMKGTGEPPPEGPRGAYIVVTCAPESPFIAEAVRGARHHATLCPLKFLLAISSRSSMLCRDTLFIKSGRSVSAR